MPSGMSSFSIAVLSLLFAISLTVPLEERQDDCPLLYSAEPFKLVNYNEDASKASFCPPIAPSLYAWSFDRTYGFVGDGYLGIRMPSPPLATTFANARAEDKAEMVMVQAFA